MEIPTRFQIGKTTYTVRVHDFKRVQPHIRGFVHVQTRRIDVRRQTPKKQAHTFWHEVVHVILHDMGDARWADEAFVDGIAKRINQVVHTAEFK